MSDEEVIEIPQWQIDEVREAKEYYTQHPNELLTLDDVLRQLKRR